MILKLYHNDITELQQSLLAAFFYFMLIGEVEAANEFGKQFDRWYNYDNSHKNITNALNFDWDES